MLLFIMLYIKLFVIFTYLNCVLCNKYCEICPNHTLCKYTISGPSEHCIRYQNVMLADNDIKEILNRVNEKRNFIAMGHSRYFPQAANMQKVVWSKELADSAQRWADQCDPEIKPDKEDDCRDLETVNVGQTIATITGTSSSISVKNFIDIWFMQSSTYKGSVAYYNMSRNNKSNYFTQMIWASTNNIGCGRARFYINLLPVDRLVCNFSPRGNIQRRPIYTIGYPSTQCEEGMVADNEFPGLCSKNEDIKDFTNPATPTSFLRIIYSVTNQIDPIHSNFNLMKENDTQRHRSQKLRHVYKNSFVLKRDNPNFWGSPPNASRNHDGFFQHKERGHSRVYHGHDHTHELDYLHPNQNDNNFRRYDYTTPSTYEFSDDYYRRKGNQECTRKSATCANNCATPSCFSYSPVKKCTRGQRNICNPLEQGCQYSTHSCETQPQCECSTLKITCATYPNCCAQTNNCKCPNCDNAVNVCDMRRNLDTDVHKPGITTERFYEGTYGFEGPRNSEFKDRVKPLLPQVEDVFWKFNLNRPRKDSSYKVKTIERDSDRKRRETEDPMNFKPFWQVDEYNKSPQLKSIRYTTISNKKQRRRKPTTSSTLKVKLATEPITITITSNIKHVTEKYLSFDELLRLRKLNASEYNARRSDDATTVATESETESTTEYTANTPFIRLKHCTRKLTCTWTAASLGDNEGNADIGNRGSRTPPGYVEGCTRTSTCTRDYMNRNKMDTLSTPSTEAEIDESNDEDYCEKRSLDVKRKDYNQDPVSKQSSLPNIVVKRGGDENEAVEDEQKETDDSNLEYCSCDDDYIRNKRENFLNEKRIHDKNVLKREAADFNTLSYGDLFYLVLRKVIEKWNKSKIVMHGKCPCSSVSRLCYDIGVFFIILSIIYF